MAISMLHARISRVKQTKEEGLDSAERDSVAVVPLGTPLLAGPGAISTVILYAQRYTSVAHYLYLLGIILLMVCLTFFSFRLAPAITRLLGKTGINVVTRLMGPFAWQNRHQRGNPAYGSDYGRGGRGVHCQWPQAAFPGPGRLSPEQYHGQACVINRSVPLKLILSDLRIPIEKDRMDEYVKAASHQLEIDIQFGEGGAGSYSDGKLFSRRNNNSSYVNRVLKTFIKFSAPEEIGYISKPHLGTDVLCAIVRNIRSYILERGGEINYGSKMTDILISEGKASGIIINGEKEYLSSSIYIALGHSARDTFEMMHEKGVAVEQRPISVGVRIEHPAETINLMRYGDKYKDFPGLGAATYSLNYTNRKIRRGVYTFCMCPGGEVINASSNQGMLVLNGMSYSRRSSAFSNAALVVSCHADNYKSISPLAGLEFQKDIERKAFNAGGGRWEAPAQNLMDFLGKSSSADLNKNSYKMGAVPADMKDIFPTFVIKELLAAFNKWKEEVPLFVSNHAILLGAETRTSSPVRIKRNEKLESVNIKNLYPIGEGSGYTGGITSSAADAIKAVEINVLQG
jgi:uncharacterized FAD-dependent dehydrogenase